MIVDASVIIDAVADSGPAARLAGPRWQPCQLPNRWLRRGHFVFEILSGLRAAASRSGHHLSEADVAQALVDAQALEIGVEATPWSDVHRAWQLAQASVRVADAIYIAAAERGHTTLLTADARIERSGAALTCPMVTVSPTEPTPR